MGEPITHGGLPDEPLQRSLEQSRKGCPIDLSHYEIDLTSIRERTLPRIGPNGQIWLNFEGEDSSLDHALTVRLTAESDILTIAGHVRENIISMGLPPIYPITVKLPHETAIDVAHDKRLRTALGVELVDAVLSDSIKLSFPNQGVLWYTSEEARKEKEYQDPEKIRLVFGKDEVRVDSKDIPVMVFNGKRWLVGRNIIPSGDLYLAQTGSNRLWRIHWRYKMGQLLTGLSSRVDDTEKQYLNYAGLNYSYRQTQGALPLWITHQLEYHMDKELKNGLMEFPLSDWQQVQDFEIQVNGDKVDVIDNSDPTKMPFYSVFKAFDPLLTTDLKPKDPAEGRMVNALAAIGNWIAVIKSTGRVTPEMKRSCEHIIVNIKKILAEYGSDPNLVNDLVQALQNEQIT